MTLLHRLHKLVSDAVSPSPSDLPDRIGFVLVVGVVLAAAVLGPRSVSLPAVGGVFPAAEGLVFCLLAFLAASAAFISRTSPRSIRYLKIPLAAAIGMALVGVVQLLPLPEEVLQQIASVNLQIYHETAEILTLFGRGPGPAARISIAPRATAGAVLELLGCLAVFLAAASLLRTRRRRRAVFWTAAVGTLVPLAAAAVLAATPHPGVERAQPVGTVFGLGFFAALGIFWAEVLTNSDRGAEAVEPGDRFEQRFPPMAVRLLLVAVCATGIALARSWAAGGRRRRGDGAPARDGARTAARRAVAACRSRGGSGGRDWWSSARRYWRPRRRGRPPRFRRPPRTCSVRRSTPGG